jgi:hypothetical protein
MRSRLPSEDPLQVMAIGSWELVRRLQYELFHVTHTLAPVRARGALY